MTSLRRGLPYPGPAWHAARMGTLRACVVGLLLGMVSCGPSSCDSVTSPMDAAVELRLETLLQTFEVRHDLLRRGGAPEVGDAVTALAK